jgi:hypothetical protein
MIARRGLYAVLGTLGVALACGLGVFLLSKRSDKDPSDKLAEQCQSVRPSEGSEAGEPSYDVSEFTSGKTRIEGNYTGGRPRLVSKLRRGSMRGGVIANGYMGGFVEDLDGDRAKELALVLDFGNDRGTGDAVIFSRGINRVRGDVPFTDLPHLALVSDNGEEQIRNLRRVGDCDGDGRPELVVETFESDCDGLICIDTSTGTERFRAYVISGNRAGKPGLIKLSSSEAPRARTIERRF